MKKNALKLPMILSILLLCSFTEKNKQKEPSKTYTLIYVDNSRTSGSLGINSEMTEMMTTILDGVQEDKNSVLSVFFSNGDKWSKSYTRKVSTAKSTIAKLNETNSDFPNSVKDKKNLHQKIFDEDLSGIAAINIYFFVSEYYLYSDLLGDNPGLLLNFFPKELQAISNCNSEKINVHILYPKDSKTIDINKLKANQLSEIEKQSSSIKYSFTAI